VTESSPARKSCVVIATFAPVPSMGGSHIRSASTILSLHQDFDVHVICTDTRPALMQQAFDFCRTHCIDITHDPVAFGFSRRTTFPMALRYFLGCTYPTMEARSVRRLPSRTVAMLRSADLVWIFRQTAFRYRSLPESLDGRVVFDVDDIEERVILETVDQPKWVRSLMARKTRYARSRLLAAAEVSLLCSDIDTQRLRESGTTKVLPNTYPKTSHAPKDVRSSLSHVLMVGLMDYYPNKDGMRWFLDDIWDRIRLNSPDALLTIAGRASDELFASDPARGIDVIGLFDDPAQLLANASVVIVPLRHGSGTRVKILEAFAHGLPVVSTSIGAEGLDVVRGESILIADDPEEFALHVVRLFQDPDYATRIASAGHALFLAKYSPEVFTKTVLDISRDVLRT
jgi:glycosyltransferase involved in cell wall biosynthesis